MYPDHDDLKSVMTKLTGVLRPAPEDVWANAVLAREFLSQAHSACRNHGRHAFVSASLLRTQVEAFVGTTITEYEFCLGLLLMTPTPNFKPYGTPIDVSRFRELEIKFPPTQRMSEFQEGWKRVQAEKEQEIVAEQERYAQLMSWMKS